MEITGRTRSAARSPVRARARSLALRSALALAIVLPPALADAAERPTIAVGVLTSSSPGVDAEQVARRVGGVSVGRARSESLLRLELRVVEVASGVVVAATTVERPVLGSKTTIGGIGSAASTVLASHGIPLPFGAPDASYESAHAPSLERALPSLVDTAIAGLGRWEDRP